MKGSENTPLSSFTLKKVLELMRANVAQDLSLSDLAQHSGFSPFHFARAFKSAVGVPPHQYLMKLRIERARQLLENTSWSVTEISIRVGYENPSYFARLFRKVLGITPARYRQERQCFSKGLLEDRRVSVTKGKMRDW